MRSTWRRGGVNWCVVGGGMGCGKQHAGGGMQQGPQGRLLGGEGEGWRVRHNLDACTSQSCKASGDAERSAGYGHTCTQETAGQGRGSISRTQRTDCNHHLVFQIIHAPREVQHIPGHRVKEDGVDGEVAQAWWEEQRVQCTKMGAWSISPRPG